VRHDEPGRVVNLHPVQNQIEVEGARSVWVGALAAELPLGRERASSSAWALSAVSPTPAALR
jgi:hypothetical protein